jgi:ubiquinone/menaquinone biosynthesis C-methylase UbiE
MDKEYELNYHKLEENYWWFQSRREIVFRLIKKMNLSKDARILEVGCSGGPLISLLKNENFQNVFGIDISENAIEVCKERGVNNTFVMDALNLKFGNEEFDLIIASDILEHIEDDFSALIEWNRVLKTNGKLIVFVPAFNSLWSHHDEINHHYRRYTKTMLLKRLRNNGFNPDYSSYWNFTLFFPSFIIRFTQRLFSSKSKNKAQGQLYTINSGLNRFLTSLLSFENKLNQFVKYPIGVSVFAISRKIK